MAITTAISEPRTTPRPKPFYKDMSAQVSSARPSGHSSAGLGPSRRI
jgi:hypothetical protein